VAALETTVAALVVTVAEISSAAVANTNTPDKLLETTGMYRSCADFKHANPGTAFTGKSGEYPILVRSALVGVWCDFDTDPTTAYTTIMQAGGGTSYFTTGAVGGTPGNALSTSTNKFSDADISAICARPGQPTTFKWDVRTTGWTERLYMQLAAGQAYSTTGVIQKRCRADPSESWSIDYSGSKDKGLANRGYPEQYPTPSGGNVFCCPKTVRGSGSDVGTSNCGTHWIGVWTMQYNSAYNDVCGRGADGGTSPTSRCDATKNAFISCE
jgi:hypothetical protein